MFWLTKKRAISEFERIRDSFKEMKDEIKGANKEISEIKKAVAVIQSEIRSHKEIYVKKEDHAELKAKIETYTKERQGSIREFLPQNIEKQKEIIPNRPLVDNPAKKKVFDAITEMIKRGYKTKEMEKEIVNNLELCSRPSFYNYLRMIKNVEF